MKAWQAQFTGLVFICPLLITPEHVVPSDDVPMQLAVKESIAWAHKAYVNVPYGVSVSACEPSMYTVLLTGAGPVAVSARQLSTTLISSRTSEPTWSEVEVSFAR